MRKNQLIALAFAAVVAVVAVAAAGGQARAQETEYVVVYSDNASLAAAHQAVAAAGGAIVSENADVGVATVRTTNANFLGAVAAQSGALDGAATNRPIGHAAPLEVSKPDDVEKLSAAELATANTSAAAPAAAAKKKGGASITATPDPFAAIQWDMAMIGATATGSYAKDQGDPGVLVGIIDTGVDGTHPDIAPNFSTSLSRNFTTDMTDVDGACEVATCRDAPNVDDNGHGTHVAGTIGAALNGIGTAGVAPKTTLVNLRAGQDSGYFFLQATVDALTYAGNNGIDVVNMSYYVDPWWMNCADNPADSPAQQMEQRTIMEAVSRALRFAHRHHVTLISSAGNEHKNLDNPLTDTLSPDYPPGSEYPRNIDTSCRILPAMGPHVIATGSVGPSTAKADYSNYGLKWVDISAPGGWFRDFFGTPQHRVNENQILSTYPRALAQLRGQLNPDGTPNTPLVLRSCSGATCGYYQYLQGTSMASPHAVGVAALIVSHFGHRQGGRGGKGQLEMNPERVEKILTRTATDHACPNPPTVDYLDEGRTAEWTATCTGTTDKNSFWGEGIVNALEAISFKD